MYDALLLDPCRKAAHIIRQRGVANANVSLRSHTYTSFYRCVGEQKPRRDITLQQSWRLYRKMKMFLYLCRRLPPTNVSRQQIFIVCDEQHPKLQQLPFTANVDIQSDCYVISRKPKEASFHAKEEDKFLHPCKIPKSGHNMQALHTMSSWLSHSVSHSVQSSSTFQKIFLKHSCNTLTTLYETG